MGQHALSFSPILVIDDNPFYEGFYKQFKQPCNAKRKDAREQNHVPLNPLNLSPIGIIAEMGEKLRRQI